MSITWEDCGYGSQRLEIWTKDGVDLLSLKVRPIRGDWRDMWQYDCGDITSAPRYATADDAKRACLEHARRLLTQTLEALDQHEAEEAK
jgi:hypothetical protein